MQVTISFRDQVMARFANQLGALGDGKARKVMSRALKHTGRKARTQVIRALVTQTGLKRRTIARAVREVRGNADALTFELETRGGNVRLKYFRARETRRGVSAAPWNKRKIFAGTFMRAGWWKTGRVVKPNWNGQVFSRAGGATESGMDKFSVERSGLYIPTEMLAGQTARSWSDLIDRDLLPRVEHEIGRLLP